MQSPGLLLVVAILSLTACGDDKGDATSDALTTSGGSSSTDAPGSSSSSSSGEPGTGSSGAPTTGTPTTGEPVTTTGEPVTGTDSSGGESSGGTSTTGVSGLSLAADADAPGGSSIAVVAGSGATVLLERCAIESGAGAPAETRRSTCLKE